MAMPASASIEGMRQIYEESREEQQKIADELRRRWEAAGYTSDDWGGAVCRLTTIYTGEQLFIKWRQLEPNSVQDREMVCRYTAYYIKESDGEIYPELFDCVTAYLQGDKLLFVPHSSRLLTPWDVSQ